MIRVSLEKAEGHQKGREAHEPSKTVGHALDRFIGTWSAEQEAEVLEAIEVFEQVDESFWQWSASGRRPTPDVWGK